MVLYPVLAGEIAKRGIKKTAIAESIGVSDKAFRNKMNGTSTFTWPEVKKINHQFFPDLTPDELFSEADEVRPA